MPHSALLFSVVGRAAFLLMLTSFTVPVFAQSSDVLYLTNGQIVPGTVETISPDSIYYYPAGSSEAEPLRAKRSAAALIFRDNGDFLLASDPEATWKAGATSAYDHIVEIDGRVLPADSIEQFEDIIYYQDALDSTGASMRVAETMAIIYRDGSHQLLANANEVALGLGRADFPAARPASDAVASTELLAASPSYPGAGSTLSRLDSESTTSTDVTTLRRIYPAPNAAPVDAAPVDAAPVDAAAVDTVSSDATLADTVSADISSTVAMGALRTGKSAREALELDRVDYEEYAAKAINKAEYLGYYLDLLCNARLDMYDKDQAVANALKLFVHDSTRVQVSSVTRDQTTAYKIKDYLKRLSLLNYDRVELLWRNLQYVTKFRLAPDGNYYGTITVEQLFRGFRDGRAIYEDITQKDVEIVLGNFRKEESGTVAYAWDVLLSDIGVEETRRR